MGERDRLATAAALIEGFSTTPAAYRRVDGARCRALGIDGPGLAANEVYVDGEPGALHLHISGAGRGNRVFINRGLAGQITLGLGGDGGSVYFGRDVTLAEQHIGSRQDDDLIAVGNDVATTGPGRWISGLRCKGQHPALLIGDCCVLSRDVVLRNSDGHPTFDDNFTRQLNCPRGDLVIEPHVWLGERSAVLKDVRVGAFSIIAFGSVVTREVPRHHLAQGVPARVTALDGKIWAWDDSPAGLARARRFLAAYPAPDDTPES
jgi:hypothetical protein